MADHSPLKHIPEPTLRRLPRYHHFLRNLVDAGVPAVSCTRIGSELSLDPTQVRKDLALTGVSGKPKIGYETRELMAAIEEFFGWRDTRQAFLAGAGNLGSALLAYRQFENYGLNIVAVFDNEESRVGTMVHGREVLPVNKLSDLARRMHILMGIIAVPTDAAQTVADRMVAGGIMALWNFAPVSLNVAPHVLVQNEDLSTSLSVLSRKLATALSKA